MSSRLAERIFQRWALRRKQLGGVFRDVHIVFETDTKFSVDVDAGLVAGRHIGRKPGGVAADEVWPFVTIHAQAVTETVGKILVVRTVARVSNYFSCGRIDSTTFRSWSCRGQGGRLRAMHDVEHFVHLVPGFFLELSQDKSASYVGLISFHNAAVIDHYE